VQALSGLLSAQNSFVAAWVDYDVQRLNLDFNLGTMQLDAQGNWVDPGPVKPQDAATPDEMPLVPTIEELPPPEATPLETERGFPNGVVCGRDKGADIDYNEGCPG